MNENLYFSSKNPPGDVEIPATVGIFSTTRAGGISKPPFDSLNLGYHVGDRRKAVEENRRILARSIGEEIEFCWLSQVHGTTVVEARRALKDAPVEADASIATAPGLACVVMTADCLPLLLFDRQGTVVAAAHAGWRGLAAGVVEATVEAMNRPGRDLVALLGPAIGPEVFEVGEDVVDAFLSVDPQARSCFGPSPFNPETRWVADLYELCRQRLRGLKIDDIYGGDACTFRDEELFFSYRRDGRTGRMATAIWLRRNV